MPSNSKVSGTEKSRTTKTTKAQSMEAEKAEDQNDEDVKKAISFECASCQYTTSEEDQFIQHTKTDHRSNLSVWCKSCDQCFSNAGVLVAHIKKGPCVKEDMIYRCCAKECTFDTPSGQVLVHHIKNCHRGNSLMYCLHCDKMFTLHHCLILHMQNDCPYKERNRRSADSAPDDSASTPEPEEKAPAKGPNPAVDSESDEEEAPPKVAIKAKAAKPAKAAKATKAAKAAKPAAKGKGRKKRKVEDSDSDPDDPSFMQGEAAPDSCRRSSRLRRK